MYQHYLALNNLQWLICPKTQTNQTKQKQPMDLLLYKFSLSSKNVCFQASHIFFIGERSFTLVTSRQ